MNSALVATNKDYGITQIYNKDKGELDVQGNIFGIDITNIKNMRKHFSEAGEAIQLWNDAISGGENVLVSFDSKLFQNNAQFKEYLSTCSKDAPASIEGYKSYLKSAGVSTDALRLKTLLLNSAITMLGGWAIQAIITTFYELSRVSGNVAEKAQELGKTFNDTKSDIDSYKSNIEDLYKTINDSGSSISDVTEARKNLMTIQDELIDKFGDEKEIIDIITNAVNGQADAFDRLTEKQWQETKNQFNDAGFLEEIRNWVDGYDSNIDRMVNEMENAGSILSFSVNDFASGKFDELIQRMEKLGWAYTPMGFVKGGGLKEIYSDLLEIQGFVNDIAAPDKFIKDLTQDANNAKKTLDSYSEIWDTYVLREKIFQDDELAQSWKDVNDAYEEYRKAFETGEKDAQDSAIGGFYQSLHNVLDNAEISESVKEYFRNMYPAMTRETEKWEFRFKVLPDYDIRALNGKTQADILEMLQTDDFQYGEQTFNSLLRLADNYGIIIGDDSEKIRQLLDLLVEWGILQESVTGSAETDAPDILFSITETVNHLNTRLKPTFDSLKSAYNDIFKDDEFKLDSIDILSTCDSIKSKMDEMKELGLTVDYSSYEDFVRVLNNAESTESDVEKAFDFLATSITQAALSGKEDFATMKAALEDLGVLNNEIVAFDALVHNAEALEKAFAQANVSMDDFIVNTENGNIEATKAGQAFIEEMVGADNATQAIAMLAFQKELCNLQEMNTANEVANLRTLAENAGYTGEVIQYLTELEQIYQEVASGTLDPVVMGAKIIRATLLQKLIQDAAVKIDYSPIEKSVSSATKSASSTAKSTADDFKESLDNFMDAQEKALDAGRISFKEYCSNISSYLQQAYDSGKISAKEFWDYQGKFLEKQKSNYDKVVRAVVRKIDNEIDKLKEQQDDIEEFYGSQISSLEQTKKLLQETNDERKRQTDLQKALYDMESAYNQRTSLVYTGSGGMVYKADPGAIRTAEENVASTRLEIQVAEIDKSISHLEELRDNEKSALDEAIEKLEDYKDKWNDVTSAYEEAQEDQLAAMILGQEWEADILSMRTDTLTNFANDYIRIQQAIIDMAWESANAQIAAQNAAMSAASNPGKSVSDSPKSDDPKSKYVEAGSGVAHGVAAGGGVGAKSFAVFNENRWKFHTGLKQGLVDSHSFDDDFRLVRSVGLKENEVPAILQKGEAVATQEQIRNIADGLRQTSDTKTQTVVINGVEYRPLQPGDKMYDMVQKFDAYFKSIDSNLEKLVPSSFYEHQKQMTDMANQTSYVSSITNNNRNVQPVVTQNITLNCPNVTNSSGVEYIQKELGHLSQLATQETLRDY